ncbi:MAG TPA: 3'-5' exonuclease [archaeon]|nr:3'-5' exonuclease [archaeon]
MDKSKVLSEIKSFLEGYNNDLKYIVNVETDPRTNYAECIIHEPNQEPRIEKIQYEPFLYMKDLSKNNIKLYMGKSDELVESKRIKYGIKIKKLETGNQKRLVDGYCYMITSNRSYNDIINYLKDGGINPYEKLVDDDGNFVRDSNGDYIYSHRDMFYGVRTTEQFFISTQSRLYKGIEEYKRIHKLTFDIETTGLRYQTSRIFAIGIRDNMGFETILSVKENDDDLSEIQIIQDFFNLINYLKPAIIVGYNSEMFDFDFILGRAKILNMDLSKIPTSLNQSISIKRKGNSTVKIGGSTEKYTSTDMWGYSIIDTLHAVKRTAAVNSDLRATGLKYVANFENISKPNRTYIKGEDNMIGKYYNENKIFLINESNEYYELPNEYQKIGELLLKLQIEKSKISDEEYKERKKRCLDNNKNFVDWYRNFTKKNKMFNFINGKRIVKQYLLDDLWETEQVDELYNQTSFMLAKIVPTTFLRICTMGTASIWNLLLTAWSYENGLAIPICDENERFSGGLARCYKTGYTERIIKIDYSSLYPMIQLTDNVFPFFDITGVMKKMLLYLTSTRNIYKKLGSGIKMKDDELSLLKEIDFELYIKYMNGILKDSDVSISKIKQLPLKILNNSLFGALGSNISFNWSDNVCAARITCIGRIQLRHAIKWFNDFGCIPLLAVTDGINFKIPNKTTIRIINDIVEYNQNEDIIENMWVFDDEKGIDALIKKYNKEEMKPPYMSVDNDMENISCLNLSRINYATLTKKKDKKTNEMKNVVKLTGNTIKSKTMPEYIEDFIDNGINLILNGKEKEFIEYYNQYVDDIFYMRIPLKKIASKSRIKLTIKEYNKRGKDKNGRDKGMQAHMELIIENREKLVNELFEIHKNKFNLENINKELTIKEKLKYVSNYMPPEPELDSMIYYVNRGYKKSHGDSRRIIDKKTGEERFCAVLINKEELVENPNMLGEYNVEKYLDAFNKRVESILVGFNPEIRQKILIKINSKGELIKNDINPIKDDIKLRNFDNDDLNESMFLEKMEVDFWNKTGYDPRLIWNGFKMHENYKVHYEIYDNALKYLNDKMIKANKSKIKSINSNYDNGDLVLIKDDDKYHLGLYNGIFLKIVRNNVDIPKSDFELELDRIRKENQKKNLDNLEVFDIIDRAKKESNERELEKTKQYFLDFKKDFNLSEEYTMEKLFNEVENAKDAFETYVETRKLEESMGENFDDY